MQGKPLARALDEPPDDRRRGLHAHLLADDRAHDQLEARPRARHAQAGRGADERREPRVAREMRADRGRIGLQIEHRRKPRGECSVRMPRRIALDERDKTALARMLAHRQRADRAVMVDRAPIRAVPDRLDARNRAPREEAQHARPIVRRFERQLEHDAVGPHGGRFDGGAQAAWSTADSTDSPAARCASASRSAALRGKPHR
ncbi:putative dNA-O6-methylguanine--protein-cysteine S-methyltransferase [Burkholderia pseudomallei A79D]|nr:putative dNA-O6-methylguanine--protein-cysteine S-methyltransferase [Burkholderia pseudomallei A79D]KGX97335.1 putative dNA-O6-methylguanine--protein-cysteine S-methyltransferase [Burkholderia pseudomallei A79C]